MALKRFLVLVNKMIFNLLMSLMKMAFRSFFIEKKVSLNPKVILLINVYKVLDVLKGNPNQTRENIATKIGIDKRTVQQSLDKLVEAKYIMRIGSKKTGYWEVIKKIVISNKSISK